MVHVMGDRCQLCGYNRDIHALEFHHIDPNQKDFSFNKAESTSWEVTQEELKKCILVCANCHREIHSGLVSNQLVSSFNQELANEVTNRIYAAKHHQIKTCKRCGATISSKAVYCTICNGLVTRSCDRPTRDELKILIRTTPFTQIAKYYSVTDNAVRKWCDTENLPRKVSDIKKYTDAEWALI